MTEVQGTQIISILVGGILKEAQVEAVSTMLNDYAKLQGKPAAVRFYSQWLERKKDQRALAANESDEARQLDKDIAWFENKLAEVQAAPCPITRKP